MASRMEKYYTDDNDYVGSRSKKNIELYKEINNSEIDKFDLQSNATVLSDVNNNIDVEKIKKILDTRYNNTPKRKSIRVDVEDISETDEKIDETREYDINAILEKARECKEDDYEKERLKKLRDTQFNILSNLNLSKSETEVENEEEKTLINLINTITEREMLNREKEDLDPLDILSDLKDGEIDEIDDDDKTLPSNELEPEKIDTSFYTNSTQFTESDFDDFNDLKAEVNSHKILLKIVIILLVIGFVVGLIVFSNVFFDLNLFKA